MEVYNDDRRSSENNSECVQIQKRKDNVFFPFSEISIVSFTV